MKLSTVKQAGRPFRSACVLLWTTLLVGCGGASVGDVSGRVEHQGKLVTSGSVVFVGSDRQPKQGAIQPDGTYTVLQVPVGEARVAIHSPDPGEVPTIVQDPNDKRPPRKTPRLGDRSKWFPLPPEYGDHEKSGLKATIIAGDNTYDLKLP
jgi:hypothetical protein